MYLMSRAGVAPKLQLTSQRSNADCAKQPPLSVRGVSVTECERREQIYLLDEDGDVGRECHERLDAGEARQVSVCSQPAGREMLARRLTDSMAYECGERVVCGCGATTS